MGLITDKDVWDVFCAKEENAVRTTDARGRIFYADRLSHEVSRPVVSEFLFNSGFRPHYPDDRSFAVCISHDVDHLLQGGLSVLSRFKEASKELMQGYWRRAVRYAKGDSVINPHYNIDKLLDIEDNLGVKSTYYFLALQSDDEDFNYRIDDVIPVLDLVRSSGCEIGLHGGHTAYRDSVKLQAEKLALEQASGVELKGYRNHFLRISTPDTWENLNRAGFLYDTTYGFPDHPGFRTGMCYPYFPYNATLGRYCSILEIPLIVMDATFLYYLRSDAKSAFTKIKEMIDKTKNVNGVFTLLWHNNYLYAPWKELFKAVVNYCKDHNAWFATGDQLNDWWRKNNFCAEYPSFGLNQPN